MCAGLLLTLLPPSATAAQQEEGAWQSSRDVNLTSRGKRMAKVALWKSEELGKAHLRAMVQSVKEIDAWLPEKVELVIGGQSHELTCRFDRIETVITTVTARGDQPGGAPTDVVSDLASANCPIEPALLDQLMTCETLDLTIVTDVEPLKTKTLKKRQLKRLRSLYDVR